MYYIIDGRLCYQSLLCMSMEGTWKKSKYPALSFNKGCWGCERGRHMQHLFSTVGGGTYLHSTNEENKGVFLTHKYIIIWQWFNPYFWFQGFIRKIWQHFLERQKLSLNSGWVLHWTLSACAAVNNSSRQESHQKTRAILQRYRRGTNKCREINSNTFKLTFSKLGLCLRGHFL